jgi:uncharacterized protein YjbI with pentapeptide repeats
VSSAPAPDPAPEPEETPQPAKPASNRRRRRTRGDLIDIGDIRDAIGLAFGEGASSTVNRTTYNYRIENETTPQPPRPRGTAYVSRPTIEAKLRDALLQASSEQPTIILYGLTGTGKSVLAMHVVGEMINADGFPGGILWVDADERSDDTIVRELCAILRLQVDTNSDPTVRMRWFWQALTDRLDSDTQKQRRSLVVINGLNERTRIDRFLPDIETNSRLLIISDDLLDEQGDHIFARIQLGAFSREESLALFSTLLGSEPTERYQAALEGIAAYYLDLPQWVANAARTILRDGIAPPLLLRQLLRSAGRGFQDIGVDRSFQAILTNTEPSDVRLLDLTSLFGPGRWDAAMLATIAMQPLESVLPPLDRLVRRSLITRTNEQYEINRLFANSIQNQFVQRPAYEQQAAQALFIRYCLERVQLALEDIRPQISDPLVLVQELIKLLAADLIHIFHALDQAIQQQLWDLVQRFGVVAYLNLLQQPILNHPIVYANLSMATLDGLVIGRPLPWGRSTIQAAHVTATAFAVASNNEIYTLFPEVAAASIQQQLRERFINQNSGRPQIWLSLTGSVLRSAVITNANLISGMLAGVIAQGSIWLDTTLVGAQFMACTLRNSLWRNCDLQQAVLSGCNLQGAVLANVNMRGADLRGSNLRGARLMNVDLRNANLSGVDFRGAYFYQTTITDAEIDGARWEGIAGAPIVTETTLRDIQLLAGSPGTAPNFVWADNEADSISIFSASITAADLRLIRARAIDVFSTSMPQAVLAGANIADFEMVNATAPALNATAATLHKCWIERANLEGSNFSAAVLPQATWIAIDAKQLNLSAANLSAAMFLHCDFTNTRWNGAYLVDVNFCHCVLVGGVPPLTSTTDQPARLHGSRMPDGQRYDGTFQLVGDWTDAQILGWDLALPERSGQFYALAGIPMLAAQVMQLANRLAEQQPRSRRVPQALRRLAQQLAEEAPQANVFETADNLLESLQSHPDLQTSLIRTLKYLRPLVLPAIFAEHIGHVGQNEAISDKTAVLQALNTVQDEVTLESHMNVPRFITALDQLATHVPATLQTLLKLLTSPAAGYAPSIIQAIQQYRNRTATK